jgi:hypothetical protein
VAWLPKASGMALATPFAFSRKNRTTIWLVRIAAAANARAE